MKYGLVVTLIVALVLFYYFSQETNNLNSGKVKLVSEADKSAQAVSEIAEAPDVKTADPGEPQTNNTTATQAEESLPEGQLFHHDPIIDSFIGMTRFSVCKTYFSKQEQDQEKLANLSDAQKQYLLPHFDNCEENAEHVKDYLQDRLMYQLSKLSHNKSLRQKYQSMLFDNSALSDAEAAEINQHISQLSGLELLFASGLYKRYFQHEVLPLVKTELQAHNLSMVDYVITQAMALIACDRGADCSATSPMMYSRCMRYEFACGMDYKTYTSQYFTPGIRNEIQITTQLMKNLFNVW